MSIQLTCDQCGKVADWLHEIRSVGGMYGRSEVNRADYPIGQLHWECIVPFIQRKDAEKEECPF